MTDALRRGGLGLGVLAFALFFAVFFTGLAPFDFEFPRQDMEGSWILASVYAGLHRLAYGTQFVFTNGPYFPLYHREWAEGASGGYILARLAVATYLAWGFARLSASAVRFGWIAVLVGAVLLWPSITYQANDSILLLVPLLTALLLIAGRAGWLSLSVGVLLSAMVALAKLSFIPFCLGAFLLVDVALLSRRRPPLALVGYVALSYALFLAAGQPWDGFWPFLVGSYQMTAAYSAALALDGPLFELLAWLVLSGLALVLLILGERRAIRSGAERRLTAALRVLLVAGFLFIALKAGFVRHDGHAVAAWGLVLFLLVLLGLPGTYPAWRLRRTVAVEVLPALALAGVVGFSVVTAGVQSAVITASPAVLTSQLAATASFITGPTAWLEVRAAQSRQTYAEIRAAQPLPALAGRVDALSNVQAAVIAAGLDYAPRPTIQENMTASPALIARNAAYLGGAQAPDHLLFAPGATDTRHPASVEGALWPLLLSDYRVVGEAAGQLILDRRPAPLPITLTPAGDIATGFGTDIPLPAGRPLVLKLDIRESPLGRVVDSAFKPPLVHLVERYADGRIETYRLIPGMIAEGMVVSPTIRTVADYQALAAGDIAGLDAPVSIRVETSGPWAYDPAITGSLAALSLPQP